MLPNRQLRTKTKIRFLLYHNVHKNNVYLWSVNVIRGKWFLPSMDPNVSLQAARLGECLVTFLALMRFLPSMDPDVSLQLTSLGKCLIAFLTLMRFLPSMDLNVILQTASPGKCLKTFLALMRFLPSMDPDVSLQLAQPGKMFDSIPCIDEVFSPVWILM